MRALTPTRPLLVALLSGLLAFPAASGAAPPDPAAQLKTAIDRVLEILEDTALKAEGKSTERRDAMVKVAEEIYDFDEMGRRSLAQQWRPLTEPQRQEFVGVFRQLVLLSYMTKIELYSGEPIRYVGTQVEGDLASVATRLVTKNGTEVPIDYRMLLRADRWYVYDVNIEGVSLVNNYRTQFNSIIRTSSFPELLKKMRARVEQLRKPS